MATVTQHARVGIFTSTEVQQQVYPGEWLRDADLSSTPVTQKINEFLAQSGSAVTNISPANISLIAQSDDGNRRTYLTSVSIIYVPAEQVYDQTNEEEITTQRSPSLLSEMTIPEGVSPENFIKLMTDSGTPFTLPPNNTSNQNGPKKENRQKETRKQGPVAGTNPVRREAPMRKAPELPRLG